MSVIVGLGPPDPVNHHPLFTRLESCGSPGPPRNPIENQCLNQRSQIRPRDPPSLTKVVPKPMKNRSQRAPETTSHRICSNLDFEQPSHGFARFFRSQSMPGAFKIHSKRYQEPCQKQTSKNKGPKHNLRGKMTPKGSQKNPQNS